VNENMKTSTVMTIEEMYEDEIVSFENYPNLLYKLLEFLQISTLYSIWFENYMLTTMG